MTGKEAEQTLSVIRTLMERSTRYTNLSGHAGVAAGVLTLVACALRVSVNTPFLPTWLGGADAACGATVFSPTVMARARGEPLCTRQARASVVALLPAFIS